MTKISRASTNLVTSFAGAGSSPSRSGADEAEPGQQLDHRPPEHGRVDPQLPADVLGDRAAEQQGEPDQMDIEKDQSQSFHAAILPHQRHFVVVGPRAEFNPGSPGQEPPDLEGRAVAGEGDPHRRRRDAGPGRRRGRSPVRTGRGTPADGRPVSRTGGPAARRASTSTVPVGASRRKTRVSASDVHPAQAAVPQRRAVATQRQQRPVRGERRDVPGLPAGATASAYASPRRCRRSGPARPRRRSIGVPGMVASSPAATSCRAASPTTVRIRAESCEPSNCHEWVYDRQEISDRKPFMVASTAWASRRRTPPGVPRKFGTGRSPPAPARAGPAPDQAACRGAEFSCRSQDQTGSVKPT